MIEKSQLFDVVPTFSSESKEPFKLDGNYVIRFQSLMDNNENFYKKKNVLEKYRSQKQLASQGILAVYAINLKEDKGQWKIIEIYNKSVIQMGNSINIHKLYIKSLLKKIIDFFIIFSNLFKIKL